jgi:hypothetical protein
MKTIRETIAGEGPWNGKWSVGMLKTLRKLARDGFSAQDITDQIWQEFNGPCRVETVQAKARELGLRITPGEYDPA